jgi:hypothetical protein
LKDELVALGVAKASSQTILNNEKWLAALIDAVFMEPGVYPKMQKK